MSIKKKNLDITGALENNNNNNNLVNNGSHLQNQTLLSIHSFKTYYF